MKKLVLKPLPINTIYLIDRYIMHFIIANEWNTIETGKRERRFAPPTSLGRTTCFRQIGQEGGPFSLLLLLFLLLSSSFLFLSKSCSKHPLQNEWRQSKILGSLNGFKQIEQDNCSSNRGGIFEEGDNVVVVVAAITNWSCLPTGFGLDKPMPRS